MTAKRNGCIDLQKFSYALIIVVFHIYNDTRLHLPGAGTAVEFFMLAAGVFFFRSWEKRKVHLNEQTRLQYPMEHAKRRLLQFLPYSVIGFALAFSVHVIYKGIVRDNLTFWSAMDTLALRIWDIPLLSLNGLNMGGNMLDGPLWSLSAMIIVEFLILCMLVLCEKHFFAIIIPVTLLFGYGYYGGIESVDHVAFAGFTTFGMIRVYLLYCIAYYISIWSRKMEGMDIGPKGRIALTVIEVTMHIMVLFFACYRNTRYYRWLETALFAVAITITISGKSYLASLFKQTKLTDFLGKYSMAIYITHSPIIALFRIRFQEPKLVYQHKYEIVILVLIASLITLKLGEGLRRISSRVYQRLSAAPFTE